jgi:uncharacterized membrane protein
MSLALTLHVLSFTIWVGGMFFAYAALRPAAASTLEPPQRLPLWAATFARFFPWVWAAVIVLPVTGYWMIARMGGFGAVGVYVHLMQVIGIAMIAIYLHVFFAPYRRLQRAVAAGDWPAGGKALASIRRMVAINLALGLLLIALVLMAKYRA